MWLEGNSTEIQLRRFVQRFGLQAVYFAGDDRTDLDAVQEIARLRQDGITALAIVVVQEVVDMVALLRKMVELLQAQ